MKKYLTAVIFALGCIGITNNTWAAVYEFYNDGEHNYAAVAGSQSLTLDSNKRCAYVATSGKPARMYCCTSASKPQSAFAGVPVTTVLPNGSYFIDGNDTTYLCSADGFWRECAYSGNQNYPFKDTAITLRGVCPNGYKKYLLESTMVNPGAFVQTFCRDPHNYLYSSGSDAMSPSNTYRKCESTSNDMTYYTYDSCSSGYYMTSNMPNQTGRGTYCAYCGGLANGAYNTTDDHTNTTCIPNCDAGYGASNGKCVDGAGGDTTCPTGQFDMSNYGGDTECITCPGDAKCDGNHIFCPVGTYVYTDYNGMTPQCASCPGYGMVEAQYDDSLNVCNPNNRFDWAKGIMSTVCKWTDVAGTSDTDAGCIAFRGTDSTGTYEFRDQSDQWYDCTLR